MFTLSKSLLWVQKWSIWAQIENSIRLYAGEIVINFIEQYKHLSLLRYRSCGVLRRSRLVSGVAVVGGNTVKNVMTMIPTATVEVMALQALS